MFTRQNTSYLKCINRHVKNSVLGLMIILGGSTLTSVHAELVKGQAPNFTLKSLRGDNIKLSEHRGEVVMLNFWATYCDTCKDAFPLLNDIYLKYRNEGFTLLSINTEKDMKKITGFLRGLAVAFPVLLDTTHEVSDKYEVAALPSTYIIDRDGQLRYVHKKFKPGNEDEYRKQVRELMEE